LLANVESFAKKTLFQKSITSLIIGLIADRNYLMKLVEAFEQIDQNHDGVISVQEFS